MTKKTYYESMLISTNLSNKCLKEFMFQFVAFNDVSLYTKKNSFIGSPNSSIPSIKKHILVVFQTSFFCFLNTKKNRIYTRFL